MRNHAAELAFSARFRAGSWHFCHEGCTIGRVRDRDLIDRVASSAGLTPGEAARVVQDVLSWYREPVEDYVRRRHAHHQLYGKRNPEIFALIAEELADRLVAAPSLSERQLRRIVYG